MKNTSRCIISLSILAVLWAPGNTYAKPSANEHKREELIRREMDCVVRSFGKKGPATWADVCYTDSTVKAGPERSKLIEAALDRAQRRKRREEQRRYQEDFQDEYRLPTARGPERYPQPGNIYAQDGDGKRLVRYEYKRHREMIGDEPVRATVQLMAGHRVDDADWNIAGNINGTSPNILTEYSWTNMSIAQVQTKANVLLGNRLVLDGMFAYGEIYSGDNRVSEYEGDNRTQEVSRTDNSGDEGSTLDLSGGLGYRFYLSEFLNTLELDEFWVTPMAGYSYHEQNLNIKDGFQTIDTGGMLGLGPFSGLDSPYDLQWKGPWFGIELAGFKDRLSGFFRFEYHHADYEGEGISNLQPSFRKFEHFADAQGMVFNIGLGYQVNDHWRLNFSADLQDWETDPGTDRLTFTDDTVRETRLNEVNWQSYALMLGATLEL